MSKLTWWDVSAVITASLGLVLAISMHPSVNTFETVPPWMLPLTVLLIGHSIYWLWKKRHYTREKR